MRRTAVNWPCWIARQMMLPVLPIPCTVRTRSGLRIHLSSDPVDDIVLRHTQGRLSSLYFPEAFVPVPPGSLVLDVGAHHGVYAAEALRRNPGARLVAVEPDPQGCRLLSLNLALNGFEDRAEIVEAAIGSETGTGFLSYDPAGSWGNRLSMLTAAPGGPGVGTRIRVVTVREILQGRAPHTVKCNAEGAEFALVPQLFDLGLFPRQLILFLHPESGPVASLLDRLRTVGYRIEDAAIPPTGHSFHCLRP
jgi:FkbM family methyltransferase